MSAELRESAELKEEIYTAIADALGNAYDCTRVWSAWGCGTMGPDDFALVAEDPERVTEIVEAVLSVLPMSPRTKAEESVAIKEYHLPIEIKRLQGEVATLKGAVDLYRETLRDRFAMAAMTGILSLETRSTAWEEDAVDAYRVADAMMEARK